MALIDVQTHIDDWWNSNQATVESAVEDYALTHPNYFQFTWSHTVPPTIRDNFQGSTQPDNINEVLHDQDASFLDIVGNVPPIPCRLKCDVYESAVGIGYTITLSFIYESDGLEYWRIIHVTGDETWREKPWHEHPEIVMP
jgi:hypothetical protein